jgi:integrase
VAARERRYTIGSYPDWTVAAAREEAKRLKREIDGGRDPLAKRVADREAPTVNDLADRYTEEHLPKKRSSSIANDKRVIKNTIRPKFGPDKVTDIRHEDIDNLHRELSKRHPTQANRVVALLSKMFTLAVKWEMRPDNPVIGIERNSENRRSRYLSMEELQRLLAALAGHNNKSSANAIRLLLLTGARRGEVLGATWDQFNLPDGIWIKPSAHTKQKKEHRVPLSAAAVQLLTGMEKDKDGAFLFPSADPEKPQFSLKAFWANVCGLAGLAVAVERKDQAGKVVRDKAGNAKMTWKPTVNVHDLRHTYASILASSGLSLPIIGQLLGHTQPSTTARYAHLFDDPLRAATERVGARVTAAAAGKVGASVRKLGRKS